MPSISVVIPLYNKKKYIKRALNSVLRQTCQNFEIIVINDGSTDGGEDEVKKFTDGRIKLIQQANLGESAARNKGIKLANSNLVAFLDADDAWKPNFLEVITRLRKIYPQAGAYGTAYETVNIKGKIIKAKFMAIPSNFWEGIVKNYFQSTLISPLLTSSSTAIPKNIFNIVGFFAEDMAIGPDSDMWCRVALKFPIAFSNQVCSIYYQNATNRICNKFTTYNYASIFPRKLEKYYSVYKYKEKNERYLREYLIKKQIELGMVCMKSGKLKEAKDILTKYRNTTQFKKRWRKLYLISLIPIIIVKKLFYLNRIKNKIMKRI